jgi:hypothetical protein
MSNTETVQSVFEAHAGMFSNAELPTEAQLQNAYLELRRAIHLRLQCGIEFGHMCYQLQQRHRRRGKEGQGFDALLARLNIKKTTAYRWIRKYKKRELSATGHEVENQHKKRKGKLTTEGEAVQLEFDLPATYPRKQWDNDVTDFGGYKKLMKFLIEECLILAKIQGKAAELCQKRQKQARAKVVQ